MSTSRALWSATWSTGTVPVKVRHGSSESNGGTLLEDAYRSISTSAGLARSALRRSCHSSKLRSMCSRQREVTADGWTRRESHLPSLDSLISIITGHETKLMALVRLDGVVQRRRRLARREGRRRAPGLERVIDSDLRQSMPHVNGSVWCRARGQQPECRVSLMNECGVLCEVASHGCARS